MANKRTAGLTQKKMAVASQPKKKSVTANNGSTGAFTKSSTPLKDSGNMAFTKSSTPLKKSASATVTKTNKNTGASTTEKRTLTPTTAKEFNSSSMVKTLHNARKNMTTGRKKK